MNKKLLLCIASVCLAGTFGAHAQTAAPTTPAVSPSGSWVVTPSVASQYMFRGNHLGGPSLQPAVEYGYGDFAAGVWANFPVKDKVPGVSDPEYDVYGSYTTSISDFTTVTTGFTWYNYPRADKAAGFYKSTFEPSVAVNFTLPSAGLKLTPKLYYDLGLKGPTAELTALYALPLKDAGTELDFTGTIGTYKWKSAVANASPDIKNWGDYWLVGVAAPFQVSKNAKLTVGWAYTKGSNNFYKQAGSPHTQNSLAVGRSVFTVSCALTF